MWRSISLSAAVLLTLGLFLLSTVLGNAISGAQAAPIHSDNSGPLAAASTGSLKTAPPGRTAATIAYDAKDGYVLLYGGENFSTIYNDTWKFASGHWTKLKTNGNPGARAGAVMTYDAKDHYVVLFGGYNGGPLSDTWKYSKGTWTQLHPTNVPTGRWAASIAYDAKAGYVLMYGGYSGSVILADSWAFSGGQWTEITSSSPPGDSYSGALAYDSANHYVVEFGGCCSGPRTNYDSTWKFSQGTWTNLNLVTQPPPVDSASYSMTFDSRTGYDVFFGGATYTGSQYFDLNSTWSFVNAEWTNLSLSHSPSVRDGIAMVYDPKEGYVLLFGGEQLNTGGALVDVLGDTWTFNGTQWTEL